MKNNKGITLISLIAYVILITFIVSVLTIISLHFRNNLNDTNQKTVQDIEFDKLNLQILKEIKIEGNLINEDETTSTKLVFSNGNVYTYVNADKAIYLNDNIKVAEAISSLNFIVTTTDNIQKLIVTVEIAEDTRTTEYVVNRVLCAHNYGNWNIITEATCAATGMQKRTCSICGHEETKRIPATGEHTYGNWTVKTAATCVAAGTQTRTCSICGNEETQTIAALGHSYTTHNATLCTVNQTYCPTCGGDRLYTCGYVDSLMRDDVSTAGTKGVYYMFECSLTCPKCSESFSGPWSATGDYVYVCRTCNTIVGFYAANPFHYTDLGDSEFMTKGYYTKSGTALSARPSSHETTCSACSSANQLFYTTNCSTHSRTGKHYYCNTHGYVGTSTTHKYCTVCGVNG